MSPLFKVAASRRKCRIFVFEDKPSDVITAASDPQQRRPNVRIDRSRHLKIVSVTKRQERSNELWVENRISPAKRDQEFECE